MSNYPELADVFTDKTSADDIASSDPNNAFDGIEAIEGLVGALGKPQSWSTTLITLLRKYRSGMEIEADGATLYVRKGEAVLENTDASRYAFRRNPADVEVGAGNIDVGTLVVGTYYVYLKGGTAASTAPVIFSTDSIAPSAIGTIPYRQLGYFLNAAVGALAVTYVWDSDVAIRRKDTYDSGWHSIAAEGTTVPLTHNLGTTKCLITLLAATDENGSNMGEFNSDTYQNTTIWTDLTPTTIKINRVGAGGYIWNGSGVVIGSYARIIMTAIK